ncbi:septal ring lytic transglycosylase RlpA family protein [Bordetella muralis]|uniref:septal ring lytic transglycosylase RlpA family protein n=1 Tax=Bordetella muralis TaxID=1649130 RepID=UPI0039F02F9B
MIRTRQFLMPFVVSLAVIIAGCSSTSPRKAGGYYKDDGPGKDVPADVDTTSDAIPRIEPLASGANRPYTVLGKRYVPITDPDKPYKARGVASWYGKKFHGNSTSIGESYDMYAMTAAHPTMPLPSYARVTSSVNGRTIIVRVNDRGPFHRGRIMDLSYTAAHKLGLIGSGSGEVTVERILPEEIRLAQSRGTVVTATGEAASTARGDTVTPTPLPSSTLTMTELEPTPVASMAPATVSGAPAAADTATAVASAANTPVPASAQPAGVYLQMGAFSQPANAQALVRRVNSQLNSSAGNVPAVVQQNGSLYRVRLGPYADRATALNVAQQVADRTGILPSLATY